MLVTFASTRQCRAALWSIVLALVLSVTGCTYIVGPVGLGLANGPSSELLAEYSNAAAELTVRPVLDGSGLGTIARNFAGDSTDLTVRTRIASSMVEIELLQPEQGLAESYAAAGVDLVTLELGWDAYQPTATTINHSYIAQRVAEAQSYADAGLEVVLDLGLQYPPDWAWGLPGSTRFADQYGQEWHGGIGTDPLDAVWNSSARLAQSNYVELVAQDFGGLVDRVRVGGLLSGEIRLPPANSGEHVDSLWAFSPGALAASPDPTWRPGTGTVAQAREWLEFYMSSVSEYAVWLTESVNSAFPVAPIDVLLPGWGLRPGDLDRVAADRVSTSSVASTGDDLAGGLDWARQIRALDGLSINITAVTTWLDAPSYGVAPRDLAPVEYLATLTRPRGIPLSGENTGGSGLAALERVREQANRHGLTRITWMPDRDSGTPRDVTLRELGAAFSG